MVLWKVVIGGLAILLSLPMVAQDVPKAEIFGGYSFLSASNKNLKDRQSLNGWEAALSVNLSKLFALECDATGHYKGVSILGVSTTVTDYTFTGGPRINFKPVFAHLLIGGDRIGASAFGFTASHTGLAVAAGGGVEYPVSSHWAARVSADYVWLRHNVTIPNIIDTTQTFNNVRVSAGVVYSFGGGARESRQAGAPRIKRVRGSQNVVRIPELGAEAWTEELGGAQLLSVLPGGPADRASLRATDVIQEVDGKPVQSAQDLAVQLSGRSGTVRLKYMRGYWSSETPVTLGARP